MQSAETQRKVARWGMLLSVFVGIVGLVYFTVRGEPVTGVVVVVLLGAVSYWEYKRRLRDLERAEMGSQGRDPFEERERRR